MKRLPIFFIFFLFSLSSIGQTGTIPNEIPVGQIGNISVSPRMRVIFDNDFAGDPDGLFALVHFLLSPSVELRGLIGSHLPAGQGFGHSSDSTATDAVKIAEEVLSLMHMDKKVPVYEGSNLALLSNNQPVKTAAARAIIDEAMRTDTKLPLYVVCGAGLTEVASAFLMEPKIASKLTLIWIGGPEYPDLAAPPPGKLTVEYNLGIDLKAARIVFNQSQMAIWQVPRSGYRQIITPFSVIISKLKSQGKIGDYLVNSIAKVVDLVKRFINLGEVYILGDSPLVSLTALQSSFEPDPSSSQYVIKNCPVINEKGWYEKNPTGRKIRVYTWLDARLILDDFFTKVDLFNHPG